MTNNILRICLGVGILFCPALLKAQNYGRMYHAYVGYDNISTTTVNNWMPEALAYPKIKNDFLTFGLDGYAVRNNVLIGGQLQLKHGPVELGNGGNQRPYVVDLMAEGGYIFFSRKGLYLYSTVGVGYGAFATHIFNTRKKYPEFVPAVPAIRENVVLIQKGVVGSITLGADYFMKNHDAPRTKGFAVGLRVGYDARPTSSNWQASQYAIAGGPAYAASGYFVRFTVGRGSIGAKQ